MYAQPTTYSDTPDPASSTRENAARDTFTDSDAVSAPTPVSTDTCAARQARTNRRDTSTDSATTPVPSETSIDQHLLGHTDPPPPHVARLLPEWANLIPAQAQVLDLLASGMSIADIAVRVNVHRGTIHRWKTQHPAFIAAMNRRRQDTLDTLSTRCTDLFTDAVNVLQDKVADRKRVRPQRLRAALAVLRAFGSRRVLLAAGPNSAEGALRQIAIERRLQLNESLKDPISDKELAHLRDALRFDFYDEQTQPLLPNDFTPPSDPRPSRSPQSPIRDSSSASTTANEVTDTTVPEQPPSASGTSTNNQQSVAVTE